MRLLLLFLVLISNPAIAYIQTEWTFYRSPITPLIGSSSGQWQKIGTAWSASTVQVYSHLDLTIESCRVAYSFNPNTGNSPTGFRVLAHTPIGVYPLAQALRSNAFTPVSGGIDITYQMKWLLSLNAGTTLSLESVGNGTKGPLIYHAVVECVWK